MELFLGWVLFASVQIAATMSPGPAFVVAVRNAMAYDRKIGVSTALGLAMGVAVHVSFALVGISFLIAQSVFLFSLIKYAGAGYLFYIGVKALRSGQRASVSEVKDDVRKQDKRMTCRRAVWTGLLTNVLNPKAVVFFTAVFTQFIGVSTPLSMHFLYGSTSVFVEFLWFAGVAIILTNTSIKRRFMRVMHWVERVCGGLMIALGVKLALLK